MNSNMNNDISEEQRDVWSVSLCKTIPDVNILYAKFAKKVYHLNNSVVAILKSEKKDEEEYNKMADDLLHAYKMIGLIEEKEKQIRFSMN